MTRKPTGLISAIVLAGGIGVGMTAMSGCEPADPPPPAPPPQEQQPPAEQPGQMPDQIPGQVPDQQRDLPQLPGGPDSDPYGG